MAHRYIARPADWTSDHVMMMESRPSMTVFEEERGPIQTGLLNAEGERLYRVTDREPLGFRVRAKSG